MKEQNRAFIFAAAGMVSSMIMLLSGAQAMELGEVGIGIILLVCSLYIVMWVHAGMIAAAIKRRFEDKKEETGN